MDGIFVLPSMWTHKCGRVLFPQHWYFRRLSLGEGEAIRAIICMESSRVWGTNPRIVRLMFLFFFFFFGGGGGWHAVCHAYCSVGVLNRHNTSVLAVWPKPNPDLGLRVKGFGKQSHVLRSWASRVQAESLCIGI